MKKRVISWLLTVVMVVSLLPTSVLADTLAADQEQQTQQEQIAPVDMENTVLAEDEETQEQQEQQEPAPETPASQMARRGGAAPMLAAAGAVQDIGTAEAFAAMEPDGNYQLTADITVTAPYGNDITGFTGFTGTFDGNGHTVTLDITASTANVGLFSKLAGGAVVKNVITAGSVTVDHTNKKSYVGGIAGYANAYENPILIENCKNTAAISGYKAVGGILGQGTNTNGITIYSCANTGTIAGANTQIGGIAGSITATATIESCYNTGDVNGFSNVAGIVGSGSSGTSLQVKNCYTTGQIGIIEGSSNLSYGLVGGGKNTSLPPPAGRAGLCGCGGQLRDHLCQRQRQGQRL